MYHGPDFIFIFLVLGADTALIALMCFVGCPGIFEKCARCAHSSGGAFAPLAPSSMQPLELLH
jgi:hypothetical protein